MTIRIFSRALIHILCSVVLAATTSATRAPAWNGTTTTSLTIPASTEVHWNITTSSISTWTQLSHRDSTTSAISTTTHESKSLSRTLIPLPWQNSSSVTTHSSSTCQTTGASSTVTSSIRATATVIVGAKGELSFEPSSLNASVGSLITFNFLGLNHTLTQSTLENPCQSNGKFDTGFNQFNPKNVSGKFVVEFKVQTRRPQWFFCAQTAKRAHCQAGMVFSLNPVGLHPLFVSNALAAPTNKDLASACPARTTGSDKNSTTNAPTTVSTGRLISTSTIAPIMSNAASTLCAQGVAIWVAILIFFL